MTALASRPSFSDINGPGWGVNGGQALNAINPDEVRNMFVPRKNIQRTNSSSSISSTSSTASSSTLVSSNGSTGGASPAPAPAPSATADLNGWPTASRKRPQQPKGAAWPAGKVEGQADFSRAPGGRQQIATGANGAASLHQQPGFGPAQGQMSAQGAAARVMADPVAGQPVLYLLSLNGTFERKTISVPYQPDTLRIGRQTNMKTVPTPINGYFDSKVLSRQHAEIWADRQGKIWIRDIKSSNGTFVNGTRLSAENRESEPHELQTSDHLELGIDIVSEDQKSVVHHKVAAKVEHAGFLNPSSSLLDMSFGELDPANGAMMMMAQIGGMPFRGRLGSQASMAGGRMLPAANMNGQLAGAMALGRGGILLTQPSTEAIVKRLHAEMRTARLQSQDLARTNDFINALLSKDDLRSEHKSDVTDGQRLPHMINGNGTPFRSDPKARFSDPPAPPPQQPLPEKPDVARASDVPSLKRGTTERPKSHPPNASPIRQDVNQIVQLTEALNMAKKEIDTQHAQMRDLEDLLHKEREARKSAEELARKLEDAAAASTRMNGAAKAPDGQGLTILEETFDPPTDGAPPPDADSPSDADTTKTAVQLDDLQTSANLFRSRIDSMAAEIRGLKLHLDEYKLRAETAEAERDAQKETLAEMVRKLRERDEEDARESGTTRSVILKTSRRHWYDDCR